MAGARDRIMCSDAGSLPFPLPCQCRINTPCLALLAARHSQPTLMTTLMMRKLGSVPCPISPTALAVPRLSHRKTPTCATSPAWCRRAPCTQSLPASASPAAARRPGRPPGRRPPVPVPAQPATRTGAGRRGCRRRSTGGEGACSAVCYLVGVSAWLLGHDPILPRRSGRL